MRRWVLLVLLCLGPAVADPIWLPDFVSATLHNQRTVLIELPPSYEQEPGRRYPVLYLQDGQNVFDTQTSAFGHDWELDHTGRALMLSHRMQEVIMVGVYNTRDRMLEYTPVPDPHHPGGLADDYERFLAGELKPWVDQHYRTRPGPSETGLMGSSLGGLVALYIGWKHPQVFGRIGCVSPSLWWDDEWLTQQMAADHPKVLLDRVWLDIGTDEGDEPALNVANTRRMHEVLLGEGYRDGQTLFYREIGGGTHDETSWAARAADVLTHLFPGRDPSPGDEP